LAPGAQRAARAAFIGLHAERAHAHVLDVTDFDAIPDVVAGGSGGRSG
jgi:hypothetical protein